MRVFFVICFLILFASCSDNQNQVFEEGCIEKAKSVVPSTLTLSFEENYLNDVDNSELDYFLSLIDWSDGTRTVEDRGFHKKKSSSKNRDYYYPFDVRNEGGKSWPHTKDIEYRKQLQDGGINIFVYDFVLEGTSNVVYEKVYDNYEKKIVDDRERGNRVFLIKEIIVKECLFAD